MRVDKEGKDVTEIILQPRGRFVGDRMPRCEWLPLG